MAQDIVDIARATYEAYVSKDRSAIEALIAADFHFSSPRDNRLDRAAYFARCWPNCQRIASIGLVRLVAAHDGVFVTYEGRTTDGRGFRNTEFLTIRHGQVSEVEVYFGWSLPHPAAPGGFIDDEAT